MNKKIASLALTTFLLVPMLALATPGVPLDVYGILGRFTLLLWQIFFALSIMAFIYAGILFVWSGSNPSKAGDAKKVVIYAVIGICVTLIGYSIERIVRSILGAV